MKRIALLVLLVVVCLLPLAAQSPVVAQEQENFDSILSTAVKGFLDAANISLSYVRSFDGSRMGQVAALDRNLYTLRIGHNYTADIAVSLFISEGNGGGSPSVGGIGFKVKTGSILGVDLGVGCLPSYKMVWSISKSF